MKYNPYVFIIIFMASSFYSMGCGDDEVETITQEEANLLATAYSTAVAYPNSFYSYVRSQIDSDENASIANSSRILAKALRKEAANMPSDSEIEESITNIGSQAGAPAETITGAINDQKAEREDYITLALFLDEVRSSVNSIAVDNDQSVYQSTDLYNTAILTESILQDFFQSSPDFEISYEVFTQFIYDVSVWYIECLAGYCE